MDARLQTVAPGFAVELDGPQDGRRVLLLHGFPQDRRCWDAVVSLLVTDGLRCARYDQRGYDPAVRPTGVAEYALPHLVGDAIAVLDGLGWDDAVVVGHDWGAVVAWGLAATQPARVSRLVALSVPHPAAYGAALASDPDQQARSAYLQLFRESERAETVLLAADCARLRALYGDVPAETADYYVRRFGDRAVLTAALAWYRAMDASTFAALPLVGVPTRFVWGADDIAVGRVAAEACVEFSTGDYDFIELPGVSHWIPETAPAAVAAAVAAAESP